MNDTAISITESDDIKNKIYTIRGLQVMMDFDLAKIYDYETRRFNEQVKNNIERFDEDFRFQLTEKEFSDLMNRISTSNTQDNNDNLMSKKSTSSWGGTRKLPYAFTEQGVYMLMTVLKGDLAIAQSKMLIRKFKEMKHFLNSNAQVFAEINSLKKHFIESDIHQKETDKRVDALFKLMDKYEIDETQGVFFQGQIFDAYAKFESFIKKTKQEIILIDNYVDISVLERLTKKPKSVKVIIYTDSKTKLSNLDIQKFNEQYPSLEVRFTNKVHDRFLIIDNTTLYHIGASLKDLGKKCFAFEILDSAFVKIILHEFVI